MLHRRWGTTVLSLLLTALLTPALASRQARGLTQAGKSRIAYERSLPPMDGKQLNVKIVEVESAPGQSSAPHKHGCAVMVYVIQGAMRMSVRGGRDSVYRAGETFFESPTDIHQTSANASTTEPARFTATFVCDHTGPLTTPVPPAP